MTTDFALDRPALYVGTYGKYAAGSIAGAWLCLEDYASRDEFLDAARALHSDEPDPELMFQDFCDLPRSLYSEGAISEKVFEYLRLSEDEREIVAAYWGEVGEGEVEDALDAFMGRATSAAEWLDEFLENTGFFYGWSEIAQRYFDAEAYLRDMRGDVYFVELGGEVLAFSAH